MAKNGYKWQCYFSDNGGKKQIFQVTAGNKDDAIKKAFIRAEKNARGDIDSHTWRVDLIRNFGF